MPGIVLGLGNLIANKIKSLYSNGGNKKINIWYIRWWKVKKKTEQNKENRKVRGLGGKW